MDLQVPRAPLSVFAGPRDDFERLVERAARLGFRQVLLSDRSAAEPEAATAEAADLEQLSRQINARGLRLWLDLTIRHLPLDHPTVLAYPSAFSVRRSIADRPVDPRLPAAPRGQAILRTTNPGARFVLDWWIERLRRLHAAGVDGFFVHAPHELPSSYWARLRSEFGNSLVLAAESISRAPDASDFGFAAFDAIVVPVPRRHGGWISGDMLGAYPDVAVIGALPADNAPSEAAARLQLLQAAAAVNRALLVPNGFLDSPSAGLDDEMKAVNRGLQRAVVSASSLRSVTSPGGAVSAIARKNAGGQVELILINNENTVAAYKPAWAIRAGGTPKMAQNDLQPLEVRTVGLNPLPRAPTAPPSDPVKTIAAAGEPRIFINALEPAVDEGRYPVKRTIGEALIVEADIFTDGHGKIAAEILFRAKGAKKWSRFALSLVENDRWRGSLLLTVPGPHELAVEAWSDEWGSLSRDLLKKHAAGHDVSLDVQEAIGLIHEFRAKGHPAASAELDRLKERLTAASLDGRIAVIEDPQSAHAMAAAAVRPFLVRSFVQRVDVEREAARFASWYELFPRSQTNDPARPGTLRDVIGRLPAIRAMGFDVLYFPPIHPIGSKNRKGRNNSLTAGPSDPGSPYAIGSAPGGHDAIHPDLGTLADFEALVTAARNFGLEIAIDFAVQCSPDHPWLREHPGWFEWRSDGSMKYAENPPKTYEDIVNVDFYAADAIPSLWIALRDVVLGWAARGVRTFRVDNPHTKPLPFWHWMIGDVKAVYPDAIFLAEAFTRPQLMYQLAKIGFSQSYTYFTWRNTKQELIEYLTELNVTAVKSYFRPHFFVNTPDINPFFLQTSGRAGFLIRACLAATLSGLWGMYSGFEICEAAALPGREEYLDSEKYEVRPRDWTQTGNIIREIAALNRIRRSEPALQTHLGLSFYNAFNEQVLYFGKAEEGEPYTVLVAVSLDPHHPQEADFEVPVWEWGLPDDAEFLMTNLLDNRSAVWRGKVQHVRLTPEAPYAIWRAQPLTTV